MTVHTSSLNLSIIILTPLTFSSDGISEHLQLLRSRYFLPHEMKGSVFDVQKLQEDVIKKYLVGKPLIKNPAEHLRMCFKFRVVRAETIAIGVSEADLELLSNYLKDDFKVGKCEVCMCCREGNEFSTIEVTSQLAPA